MDADSFAKTPLGAVLLPLKRIRRLVPATSLFQRSAMAALELLSPLMLKSSEISSMYDHGGLSVAEPTAHEEHRPCEAFENVPTAHAVQSPAAELDAGCVPGPQGKHAV